MAPLTWQSNNAILFYFTQNSVSEIYQCQGTEVRFGISSEFSSAGIPLSVNVDFFVSVGVS